MDIPRNGSDLAANDEVWLTSAEAGALAKVKPKTLSNWRALQIGPPYSKLGSGSRAHVRYRKVDVLEWLKGQNPKAA